MIGAVAETIEALERRIDELRVAVREAVLAGDRALAGQRRSALRSAERAWEDALDEAAPEQGETAGQSEASAPDEPSPRAGSLLPLREQVYEALSLLQVPAAPKLIATVHEAFFGATFPTTRVTSSSGQVETASKPRDGAR